jgi:hypothetical protein
MSSDFLTLESIRLGNKLLKSVESSEILLKEIEARFKQKDLASEVLYSGEDEQGYYVLACLAERCISTLPECLKKDLRFKNKTRYHELTFTQSSVNTDLNYKIDFYQRVYLSLYDKLQDSIDKQIVIKVCFTENRWLRDIGFGPYEEVAYVPEELSTIALTCVDAEAYHYYLNSSYLKVA